MNHPANDTEDRVRDVLDALAGTVPVSSDAYRGVQAEWRRRERRRRRVAAVVAAVVILLAVVVGLWALNRTQHDTHVVFDPDLVGTQPSDSGPAGPVPGPGGRPADQMGQP